MTDWTTCRVVRDRDGDLWTNYAGMWHTPEMAPFSADRLGKKFAPITPVLDANGLPVVTPAELAAAWDEGFDAMSDTLPGDYYPPAALGISNPYREVLDGKEGEWQ